ncbi:MAG: gamma-glutamyl-gamma-aminobutyrate hydrolase family protein [Nitrospirota bacterium]
MGGKPLIGITMDREGREVKMKHVYASALRKSGGVPVFLPPGRDAPEYAALLDGLLIPGGDDLDPRYYGGSAPSPGKLVPVERSDFELSLLESMVRLYKPVLAICYGMQLVNVFFGGALYQDIETEMGVTINHKTGYHTIVVTENRFLEQGMFSVNSTHHQGVRSIGKGLSAFVFAPDTLTEAFFSEEYPFLVGVQWHPERDREDAVSRNLFRKFIEAAQR